MEDSLPPGQSSPLSAGDHSLWRRVRDRRECGLISA